MADKLIVLADLGRMKAYRVTRDEMSKTPRLEVVGEFDNSGAQGRLVDKVSDKAGRFPGGNGGSAMSIGENHNLKSESTRRSVKQLSEIIGAIVEKEKPVLWYFAASKEINQKIVDELSAGVRSKLKKNVAADLTKVAKAELLTHF
jgi:hypothetical protein